MNISTEGLTNDEKVKSIQIAPTSTVLEAIKQMDQIHRKLLLILGNNNDFLGVLSIGDIQRYLIKQQDFGKKIIEIIRKDITVCNENTAIYEIKEKMFYYRTEFMPVLDNQNRLVKVYFWEDIFPRDERIVKGQLDVPVVIMAGGKGSRLKPITNIIPKPLIPLGEKPIIQIIIERFHQIGSSDFFLSVNYKSDMIKYYLEQSLETDLNIHYIEEDKPLGTAGSLFMLKEALTSPFFVTNCDILIDQDYQEIYDYHMKNKNDLTIVAALKHYPIRYGVLDIEEEGKLKAIREKPELTFWVNAGLYILNPSVLEFVPDNTFYNLTELIEKVKNSDGRIGVFPVSEKSWLDIGIWKEYDRSTELFNKKS